MVMSVAHAAPLTSCFQLRLCSPAVSRYANRFVLCSVDARVCATVDEFITSIKSVSEELRLKDIVRLCLARSNDLQTMNA